MGKRHKPEEIIAVPQRARRMKVDQVKRLKHLEVEKARLRKAVSDLTLDRLNLTETARGNF